jgi:hypothetical protein
MDIVLDMETGTSVPPPAAANPATVQLLIDEARRMHEHLIARELVLIDRVARLGQLWLAASALFAAAGLFGGLTADLWLAFGFACGFALSLKMMLPQQATLAGMLMVELNEPYALADEDTPSRLLSTLDEMNKRACAALAARLHRYTVSVVMLAVYVPLALLLRVVGV